jgi:hypothetical protein
VLAQEWSDGSHELCGVKDGIEERVEGNLLVFSAVVFALHARSVKTHIPVG